MLRVVPSSESGRRTSEIPVAAISEADAIPNFAARQDLLSPNRVSSNRYV